jgi:hypothetical protein
MKAEEENYKEQDDFILSPLELLTRYGKFPLKLTISLLLLILTTCQILLIVSNETESTRQQEHLFYNLFLEESSKADIEDYNRKAYLFTIPDIKTHMLSSLQVIKS